MFSLSDCIRTPHKPLFENMNKYFTLIILIGLASFTSLSAQSDRSEKVKTRFLQLPNYDLTAVDPGSISVEYGIGTSSFGKERLKDTKSTCMPKGGGIKDAVQLTTYYYEVPYNTPASYLVAKNAEGKVIFAEAVTLAQESIVKFGFDKCSYWVAETMKKDWADGQQQFKSDESVKAMQDIRAQVNNSVSRNLYPSFVLEEFKVYSAKGKSFDYADLDHAQSIAINAYEGYMEKGPNGEGFELLGAAISIWEKELESLDLDNKKSRINKSIGKGLYENLTNAYLYIYEVDKGIKAGLAGLKLYGNLSSDRSRALEARIDALRTHQIAINQNAQIAVNPAELKALGMEENEERVPLTQVSSGDVSRLESEVDGFRFTQAADKVDANEAMHEEAVASGEVNPYERYITETATQGKMLIYPPTLLADELSEFPKEICLLTDLSQITIANNKIASLPAEIKQLSQLKKLKLTGNQLTSLPPEIGEMASLESLNLSNNPLTEIPEAIRNCTSLKRLTLKGTQLSSAQLKQIQEWLPNAKVKF